MSRPAAFDVLFEPVRIGPVTAKNRFFQVPHCNGMGRAYPSAMAAMRGVKAEGGWAVVCTEQCDIHHSGNHPREIRLWDEKDIPTLVRATGLIHRHGALAAIELAHNGCYVGNLETRAIPMAPSLAATRGFRSGHRAGHGQERHPGVPALASHCRVETPAAPGSTSSTSTPGTT